MDIGGQIKWKYEEHPHRSDPQPIDTKVVGVTFEGRQRTVAQLTAGDKLWLHREPQNSYDSNAIIVLRQDGAEVGYIPRPLAAQIAGALDRAGRPVQSEVVAVVGGTYPGQYLGVRIRFVVPKDSA